MQRYSTLRDIENAGQAAGIEGLCLFPCPGSPKLAGKSDMLPLLNFGQSFPRTRMASANFIHREDSAWQFPVWLL